MSSYCKFLHYSYCTRQYLKFKLQAVSGLVFFPVNTSHEDATEVSDLLMEH